MRDCGVESARVCGKRGFRSENFKYLKFVSAWRGASGVESVASVLKF